MKNIWIGILTLVVVLGLLTSAVLAQAPTPVLGDYGSVATGSWDAAATWKMYSSNNAFDSTATGAPSSSRNVFILAGTTVTYATSSQNCKSLIIQAGATLQSSATLPASAVYLKVNGPTIWVDGNLGSGPTDALSIETKYSPTITLAGTGIVNIGQVRPNSGQTGTLSFVFAMNANLNYAGTGGTGGAGLYTSRGLQTSSTITINPGVTVTFAPLSHCELTSSSSTLGNMNTTLNVKGTLNLPGSSLILADSAAYLCTMNIDSTGIVNVGKNFTPYLTGGGLPVVNIAFGGQMNILSGGTADFTNASATVNGSGTFALRSGATIKVGALSGLDPASGPVRTTVAIFDTSTNYSFVGIGVQRFGSLFPDSVANLTIGSASIDTVTTAKKVKGILQVDGWLINSGGLTTVDTAVVNGTYQHNATAAAMPVAKWNTGSLCLVTCPVTTATTGFINGNQNFYNYKVDSPTHAGAGRLGFDGNTIAGNLIIHNTNDPAGASTNYVAIASKTSILPITVMGDVLIDSSAANMSIGSGSTPTVQQLGVRGNIVVNGLLNLNGSGITSKVFAYGNVIVNSTAASALRGHSAAAYADSLIFAGTGIQQFVKPVALGMSNLQFVVMGGSTLQLNDTTILKDAGSLPAVFTLKDSATLICGNPLGLDGALTSTGGSVLSRKANYVFNSASAQVTGSKLPPVVNNLTIDDSLGVTLTASDTVNGVLTLANGILTTGAQSVIVASSGNVQRSAGYVNGTLGKVFDAPGAKSFEVGTANGYSPVSVNVTTGSGAFSVLAVQGQHPNTFDATKSLLRYWTLTADPSITQADLVFSYLASDVVGTESQYGGWWYSGTGTVWSALASVNNVAAHTVSVPAAANFSDWSLGESVLATGVADNGNAGVPKEFFVAQNFPNPFNPTTTITFGLPEHTFVTVRIFNVLGQELAIVSSGERNAGVHSVTFDASRFSSGMYLYRVQAGDRSEIKRMMILK